MIDRGFAIQVTASLGDSAVGVRQVRDPRGGRVRPATVALIAVGVASLIAAAIAFVVGDRAVRADRAAYVRWIEIERRSIDDFRPGRLGRGWDGAAFGGLLGGLGCLGWALARRHREREPRRITVGHGAGVDFPSELGGERFELVGPRGDGFVLRVPSQAALEPTPGGAPDAAGVVEVPLDEDARFSLAVGRQRFVVAAVVAPRLAAGGHRLDPRTLTFVGGSALAHLALLALLASVAPAPGGLSDDDVGVEDRLISLRSAPAEPELASEDPEGGSPGREATAAGDPGKAGARLALAIEGRATRARSDARTAAPAGEGDDEDADAARAAARRAGILGLYRPASGLEPIDFAAILGDRNVRGGPTGNDIGETARLGYGVWGIGPGADGTGRGTIDVTDFGLAGRGTSCDPGPAGCTGDRGERLAGLGAPGLRRHAATSPIARIGDAVSSGGIDPATIRRHIRGQLARIRHCYERALLAQPALSGTTTARFQISPEGVVQGASAEGLGAAVDGCVADVIAGIHFPSSRDGGYVNVTSYPFTFAQP